LIVSSDDKFMFNIVAGFWKINEHLCTRWCLPWRCWMEKQVMVRCKVSRSSTATATDGALLLLLITRHN